MDEQPAAADKAGVFGDKVIRPSFFYRYAPAAIYAFYLYFALLNKIYGI